MANTKPNIINGICEVTTNEPFIATLLCYAGYRADGAALSRMTKNADGTESWNPPELECALMTVTNLPRFEHGSVGAVERKNPHGDTITGDPPYILSDQVKVDCVKGYEYTGNPAELVQINDALVWEPPTIRCEPKTTMEPPAVENGSIFPHRGPYAFDKFYEINCNRGFKQTASLFKLTVNQNGELEWSPPSYSCERMIITTKPTLINGTIESSQTTFHYGDKIKVHCNDRYESDIEYFSVRGQGNTLIWNPSQLHCQPMTLDKLPNVVNGSVVFNRKLSPPYHAGTQVTISCDKEHSTGNPTSEIIFNPKTKKLEWEPDNIQCNRIKCPEPPIPPAMGSTHGSERKLGDTITYSCPPGYEVLGRWKDSRSFTPIISPDFKCNPLGNWMPELPEEFQCEAFHCPELTRPNWSNLKYSRVLNGTATYECVANKKIVTRNCQGDGTWSGHEPTCPSVTYLSRPNLMWIIPLFMSLCLIVFYMIRRLRNPI